jgi:hypothetical protein
MVREYFEEKRVIIADNLKYADSTLISLDGQVIALKDKYEYDLAILNKRIARFQEIKANNTKRLKEIEKKIAAGYKYIDIVTNKAYKTEKGITQVIKARDAAEKVEEGEAINDKAEPPKEPKVLKEPKETLDELLDKKEE